MGDKKDKTMKITKLKDFRYSNDLWILRTGKLTTAEDEKKRDSINPKIFLKKKRIKTSRKKVWKKGRKIAIHCLLKTNNDGKNERMLVEIISKFKRICKKHHFGYKIIIKKGSDDLTFLIEILSRTLFEVGKYALIEFVNYLNSLNITDNGNRKMISEISVDMKTIHDCLNDRLAEMQIRVPLIERINELKYGVEYTVTYSDQCLRIIIYWNLETDEISC